MSLVLGFLEIPKNKTQIKQSFSKKPRVVGAKSFASRPLAGVSCNLIYRTLNTSQEVYHG